MSSGVVYFTDAYDAEWFCVPRQELRRVRIQHLRAGVTLEVTNLHGIVTIIPITTSSHSVPTVVDAPNVDPGVEMIKSLTTSIDTDVTWMRDHGDRWTRSETRPV